MENFRQSLALVAALFLLQTASAAGFMVTVTMKNNDIVSGKTQLGRIAVTTPYGVLNIPAERLNSLKLGVPSDPSQDAQVLAGLKKLQSAAPDEAEAIYNSLLNRGTVILAAVRQFTDSPDYKVSDSETFTVEDLLDDLYTKAGLMPGDAISDVVNYDGINTVEGTVNFPDLVLQSDYGTLQIKRDMIYSIEVALLDDGVLGENTFKLKANTHISGNEYGKGWLNTGIKVKPGDKFQLTASGKIVLQSLSGGVYGPDGYVSGTKDAAYAEDMETRYGSLVYKIGENGIQHNGASQLEATAVDEGTIYLAIYETVFNKDNTGFYVVKVTKK